jgi:hypothetical protein
MARYEKAHLDLVQAEYKFYVARNAVEKKMVEKKKNKEGEASPSAVKPEEDNRFIWALTWEALARSFNEK